MTSQSDDNSDTMLPKYAKHKKQRLRALFGDKTAKGVKEDESDDDVESDSSSGKEQEGKY